MEVEGEAFPVKRTVFVEPIRQEKEAHCTQRNIWKAEKKQESAKRRREVVRFSLPQCYRLNYVSP